MEITITKGKLIENFEFVDKITKTSFPNNLFEHSKFEQLLYKTNIKEGLIKTYAFEQALKSLSQYGQTVSNESKKQIYLNTGNIANIKQVIRHINLLGYIIGQFKVLPKGRDRAAYNYVDYKTVDDLLNNVTETNTSELWVIIEPKFDVIDSDKVDYLYHLTKKRYLEKIFKKGLVPRSESKKSFHPDRIYVVTNVSYLNDIIAGFTTSDNVDEFVILKIDYKLAGKPELHNDPNYFTYGYYLIDNVNPTAIIETIEI